MVLRLIRDLPGDRALLPPSSADRSAHLAPALERQNHTTSPSAHAPLAAQKNAPGDVRPPHPAPNVRDDREPPLLWVRDGREHRFDLPDNAMLGTCDTLARRAKSEWVLCDVAACRFAGARLLPCAKQVCRLSAMSYAVPPARCLHLVEARALVASLPAFGTLASRGCHGIGRAQLDGGLIGQHGLFEL